MRSLTQFVKPTLAGGAIALLPIALLALLAAKVISAVRALTAPLADQLPPALRFPTLIAMLTLPVSRE